MICLLLLRLVSSVPFLRYEDMLFELQLASSVENTELLELGSTIEGNKVSLFKINSNSVYNCLIVGGIHSNEQSSTLQVMEDIRQSLRRQKVLDVNLWFIPILNPDGYLQMQKHFLKYDNIIEIYKNQRDTQCSSYVQTGVDLNRNFAEGSYSECDPSYQGEHAFSEPETQIVRDLLEDQDFHLVITYFTGHFRYTVPESYPVNSIVPFTHEEFPGSLVQYANSKGIFSVTGFVSEENRPRDFQFLDRNIQIFFALLNRISDNFYTTSEYKIEENRLILFISVQNRGIYDSEGSLLVVQSSELAGQVEANIEYEDRIEEYEEFGENYRWELTLKEIKIEGVVKIKIVLGNVVPEKTRVTFWIDQTKPIYENVRSASLGNFDYLFVGTVVFVLAILIFVFLCPCIKIEPEEEKKQINIPTRPLPWEFL